MSSCLKVHFTVYNFNKTWALSVLEVSTSPPLPPPPKKKKKYCENVWLDHSKKQHFHNFCNIVWKTAHTKILSLKFCFLYFKINQCQILNYPGPFNILVATDQLHPLQKVLKILASPHSTLGGQGYYFTSEFFFDFLKMHDFKIHFSIIPKYFYT